MIGSQKYIMVSLLAYASVLPQTVAADLAVLLFAGAVLVLGS